jgi:hypothetical protein
VNVGSGVAVNVGSGVGVGVGVGAAFCPIPQATPANNRMPVSNIRASLVMRIVFTY